MFEWMKRPPKCPVDAEAKSWLEDKFSWLVDEFGLATIRTATTIEPTSDFLPTKYVANLEAIDDLMVRVVNFMNVAPESLVLSYYDDYKPVIGEEQIEQFSSGNDREIWLEANSLENPAYVVASLSREIAHVRLCLLDSNLANEEDHEEMSELLAIFLGVGIFLANTAFLDGSWSDGTESGWSMIRTSNLSMDMFAYALALYALARDEQQPEWACHLRPDVRVPLKNSIRYIVSTGDCSFVPAVKNIGEG